MELTSITNPQNFVCEGENLLELKKLLEKHFYGFSMWEICYQAKSEEELEHRLSELMAYMIKKEPFALPQLLYAIDIPEGEIKKREMEAKEITKTILTRTKLKLLTRLAYSSSKKTEIKEIKKKDES